MTTATMSTYTHTSTGRNCEAWSAYPRCFSEIGGYSYQPPAVVKRAVVVKGRLMKGLVLGALGFRGLGVRDHF